MALVTTLKFLRFVYEVPAKQIATYLSMSEHNYHKIERGEVQLSIDNVVKISELFMVNIDTILKSERKEICRLMYETSDDQFIANQNRIRTLLASVH